MFSAGWTRCTESNGLSVPDVTFRLEMKSSMPPPEAAVRTGLWPSARQAWLSTSKSSRKRLGFIAVALQLSDGPCAPRSRNSQSIRIFGVCKIHFECAKAASSSQPGACLSPPLPHGDEFRGDGIHGADMVDEPITNCLIDPV